MLMVPPGAPAPVSRPAAPCSTSTLSIIAESREMASRSPILTADGTPELHLELIAAREILIRADVPLVLDIDAGRELQNLLHVGEVEILDQLLRGHDHRLRNFARRQIELGGD